MLDNNKIAMTHNQPELFEENHKLVGEGFGETVLSRSPGRPKRSFDTSFMSKYSALPQVIQTTPSEQRGPCPLPKDYQVTPFDVVCGRGRANVRRPGNKRFREVVGTFVESYQAAKSKVEKAAVLSAIVDAVRAPDEVGGPEGRFVKQLEDGTWCELGDTAAREKAGHAIREAVGLEEKRMSSSGGSKRAKMLSMDRSSLAQRSSSLAEHRPSFISTTTSAPVVQRSAPARMAAFGMEPLVMHQQRPPMMERQRSALSVEPPTSSSSMGLTQHQQHIQALQQQPTTISFSQQPNFPRMRVSSPTMEESTSEWDFEPVPLREEEQQQQQQQNNASAVDYGYDEEDEESGCIFGRMIASLPPPSPASELACEEMSWSCWSA